MFVIIFGNYIQLGAYMPLDASLTVNFRKSFVNLRKFFRAFCE